MVGTVQRAGNRYKPEHKGVHMSIHAASMDPFAGRLGGFDS